MRPFSQKQPFEPRDMLIQGHSVRQVWGREEPVVRERRPLRRDPPDPHPVEAQETGDQLRLRLAEELDYAGRMLEATGDQLSSDPIAVSRHGMTLQSLDIVSQLLGHIANVIRSSDPERAVERIGMSDLKARLRRSGAL